MSIGRFISDNWGMIILLVGMGLILASDTQLERRMVRRVALVAGLLMIYSALCYLEWYYALQPQRTIMRLLLIATNYSLVTLIIVNVIMILFPTQKLWVYAPTVLNGLICYISIPTGIVFKVSEDNNFGRGVLGYLPYCVSAVYMVYLFVCLFRRRRNQKEDYPILIFIMLTSVICLVVPIFLENGNSSWFYLTITIDVVLYYVFLLQQYTKRDSLTKLLNRQSYYSDAVKYRSSITAVITMDMNELKKLNDNNGHASGDKALKALAECFWKSARDNQRLYRIGGDEYAALCINNSEEDVKALVARIREEVSKTPYSCSIGYAMKADGMTVEKTYKAADKVLYEDKRQYYISSGQDRRR